MAYYTYILRCADGALYTGITTDPARRLAEHLGQGGRGARYTAANPPVRCEALWLCADRGSASRLEYRIKALTKSAKERLLLGEAQEGLLPPDCSRLPVEDVGAAFGEENKIDKK